MDQSSTGHYWASLRGYLETYRLLLGGPIAWAAVQQADFSVS
jgi:hypothetical protein